MWPWRRFSRCRWVWVCASRLSCLGKRSSFQTLWSACEFCRSHSTAHGSNACPAASSWTSPCCHRSRIRSLPGASAPVARPGNSVAPPLWHAAAAYNLQHLTTSSIISLQDLDQPHQPPLLQHLLVAFWLLRYLRWCGWINDQLKSMFGPIVSEKTIRTDLSRALGQLFQSISCYFHLWNASSMLFPSMKCLIH